MMRKTNIKFSIEKIKEICQGAYVQNLVNFVDDPKYKTEINQPTGDFFYDSWVVKEEFKNSVFDDLLKTLPKSIGQARLIILKPGTCYHSHSDIDDRFHINLQSQYSYLIDLDDNQMYNTEVDGEWYEMNAGKRHVAANFGSIPRIQFVVRKLLPKNNLRNPVKVNMRYSGNKENKFRFIFDDEVSPWLNYACKNKIIDKFKTDQQQIWFEIEKSELESIQNKFVANFNIEEV